MRPHRWTDVAMVFQGAMNALNPVRTVGRADRRADGVPRQAGGAAARQRAGELLELVGIPRGRGERYPHEFSGGMRQRAAIAMALACEPKVLLADEPTTALDVMVQAQILELLVRLTGELGLALVLVTHDLPVVAQVCDRAAVMYAGRDRGAGPMDALYPRPAAPVHADAVRRHARPVRRRRGRLDPGCAAPAGPADRRLPVRAALRPAFEPCAVEAAGRSAAARARPRGRAAI